MKALKTLARAKTFAAIATLGLAAGAANASFFNIEREAADLVAVQASFVGAAVQWSQEIGGETVRGVLTGALTYHGGVAGCAKIVMKWRNDAGSLISTDVSGEACSATGLPSFPKPVSEIHSSDNLRKGRLELHTRGFTGGYAERAHRFMKAGD